MKWEKIFFYRITGYSLFFFLGWLRWFILFTPKTPGTFLGHFTRCWCKVEAGDRTPVGQFPVFPCAVPWLKQQCWFCLFDLLAFGLEHWILCSSLTSSHFIVQMLSSQRYFASFILCGHFLCSVWSMESCVWVTDTKGNRVPSHFFRILWCLQWSYWGVADDNNQEITYRRVKLDT